MQYRKLGKTGIIVSEIGMGLEHLLEKDEQVVIATMKAAIDGGVTYFDCHPGHDLQKDSISYAGYEKLGKALRGVRNELCISYIAPYTWRSPADAGPRFESYLQALGTDYTDVFIVQFCDKAADYEHVMSEDGLIPYVQKLKAEGKVRAIGISTHSSAIAHKAIYSGVFDILMYPINPAFDVVTDEEQYKSDDLGTLWDAANDFTAEGKVGSQPRKSVYLECESKGIGLVAMKPFAGGFIFKIEQSAGFTPVNLIAYALAQNGVSTVVPGCVKPEEINEILAYHTCKDDVRDYSIAVANSRWSLTGNCLYCNHCLPCSAGINVGQVNRLLDAHTHSFHYDSEDALGKYRDMHVKASACMQCGVCMERCPFKVNVIEKMKCAAGVFENI